MVTSLLVLARTLHFGGAMMLFALPFFTLFILRPAFASEAAESYSSFCRKMNQWLIISLVVEALSGVGWLWLAIAAANGQSPWRVPAIGELAAAVEQTPLAQLWLVRGALGIALGVALYFVFRQGSTLTFRSPASSWIVLALSGGLLASLAWAGNPPAGIKHQLLHLLVDIPHLLIAAVWPTGLIPMAFFLRYAKRSSRALPARQEVDALQRFSQASLVAVAILFVSGTINVWLMIGSWENLVATTAGRLFLCKMAVVILMVALGACNRLVLLPRIDHTPIIVRTLGRIIIAESFLALLVLLIVAMHV
jgi:putative copper resistance protein D